MDKKYLLIFLIFIYINCKSKTIVNGYYLSLQNDTVYTKILYYDILQLQKELHIENSNGEKKIFYPNDINGFAIEKDTNLKLIDFSIYYNALANSGYDELSKMGILTQEFTLLSNKNLFNSSYQNTHKEYKSVKINDKTSLFLEISRGNKDYIQVFNYYYYFYRSLKNGVPYLPWLQSVGLMFKENKFIPFPRGCRFRQYAKWLNNCVSDYQLLAQMVRKKNYPVDYDLIVDTYNEWREKKASNKDTITNDTLVIMRGVFDAKKYYKASKIFWPTFIGASFYILPGAIAGLILISRANKHQKVEIPKVNLIYLNHEKYQVGYKEMVKIKNQKALDRGILFGSIISFAVVLPIIVITN